MKSAATLAAAALMLGAAPLSANAAGWTGCYAGAHGGYAIAAHDVSVPALSASVDGVSSEGFQGGPIIGCDFQADRFVIGAFADYAFRSVDTDVTIGATAASGGLEDAWSAGIRAGVLVSPQTLVYGLAVYQHSDVDDAGTGFLSDVEGFGGGGGIETEISPGWALRGEYRYIAYDDEDIAGVANIDTDEHSFRAAIVWRFLNY